MVLGRLRMTAAGNDDANDRLLFAQRAREEIVEPLRLLAYPETNGDSGMFVDSPDAAPTTIASSEESTSIQALGIRSSQKNGGIWSWLQ